MKSRKILFVHDGPRWKDMTDTYFGKAGDKSLIDRYHFLGEHVNFLMRANYHDDCSDLLNFSDNESMFFEVPTFNRPKYFHHYFKALKIIKKVVHEHDALIIRLPSTIGGIAKTYADKYKIPYIIEVVACPWDSLFNYNVLGKIYAPFAYFKLKNKVYKAENVMYVTQKFLQSRYPNKNNNIGLSDVVIQTPDQGVLKRKIEHIKKLNKSKTFHLATLAAVDVIYKGHDDVFRAISILVQKGYKLKYHIAGSGSPKRLEKLVGEYGVESFVVFEGSLSHNSIFSFLDKIDIYIQPSKVEGLPRALVEAMSRACVCIGSSAGGIPELLPKDMIFNKNNIDELVYIIERVILNSELMEQCSNANFNKAKTFQFELLENIRKSYYKNFLNEYF
ncbi:MAG TPA: glycosyltransferase [Saprospiraceae bacterium]|nr:glycosyltransferase [Saprospiraceae bacterium]